MAGKFSVGSRVQAIDELGRWCAAKVVRDNKDRGYLVSFPGYPEHDIWADEDSIRHLILPYEEQQRRK